MIFVLVIWISFGFFPCKKKKIEKYPCKIFLYEKGLWPHQNTEVA